MLRHKKLIQRRDLDISSEERESEENGLVRPAAPRGCPEGGEGGVEDGLEAGGGEGEEGLAGGGQLHHQVQAAHQLHTLHQAAAGQVGPHQLLARQPYHTSISYKCGIAVSRLWCQCLNKEHPETGVNVTTAGFFKQQNRQSRV